MKDWQKLALGAGGILAAVGIAKMVSKKETTPEGYSAGVGVAFGPSESVLEGQSIALVVVVKNTSTRSGVAVAATLTTTSFVDTTDFTIALATKTESGVFAANESKTYTYNVIAPLGKGGQNLRAFVNVYDPSNVFVASASANEPITATPAPIVYGATISIS